MTNYSLCAFERRNANAAYEPTCRTYNRRKEKKSGEDTSGKREASEGRFGEIEASIDAICENEENLVVEIANDAEGISMISR